jgi:hypothetical protein
LSTINRLLRLYAAENDIDPNDLQDEEDKKPFKREPDVIVHDVDGYYLVKFLEQEFKKKDLGGIFKRPNGKPFNGGFIKSIRDGKKGVTADFLAAVQDFYPNIYQDLQGFMEQINGEGNFSDDQLGQEVERKTREETNKRLMDLKNDGTQPETQFCKFLVAITGLNVAQLKDFLQVDPNRAETNAEGKKSIPRELVQVSKDAIGFSNDDFKNYKADPNSVSGFTNDKIQPLKKKYLMAAQASKLKKIAELLLRK